MLTQITDLGTLKFGEPYSFNFLVKNSGEREVHLKKLSVGCTSCTKASTPVTHLNPSEQAVISVVFTPGTKGIQKKSVTVSYDDTSLRLEFIAYVD